MGMYAELIFGAELKRGTPENVIDTLKYMIGDKEEKPANFPLPDGRCEWLFRGSSGYFGVSSPISKMWKDDASGVWVLSTRSNLRTTKTKLRLFLNG